MKPLLLLALAALAAALPPAKADPAPACCAGCRPAALSPRSLYQLGGAWTDDAGRPFRLADLRGHPVVLAMIFTRCAGICPATVADMSRLRADLPAGLRARSRFVLASFDSAGDTPAVLRAYRARMGLNDPGWILLRAGPEAVRDLAAALGVSYTERGRGQFVHSSQVTVLDAEGDIVWQRPSLGGALREAARAIAAPAG